LLSQLEESFTAVIAEPPLEEIRMAPPPETPPGWRTGPPDFVGMGTIRSGTTWWHYLISCHPDVARAPGRPKEVRYFNQFSHTCQRPDPQVYYEYFPRPQGKQCGEWSPRYMFDPWTPPLLAQLAPQAKLLVLVRDPLERLISNLTYLQYRYEREPDQYTTWREFLRSLYGSQLLYLLSHFPRQQLLVLQYERCVADPQGEAKRTFDFLGLDPGRLPLTPRHTRPRNPTRWPKIAVDCNLAEKPREMLRRDLRTLGEHFPMIDQSLWPSAAS
jgi:hypothetical protein